jgi:predicted heme/steroid binding protein
MQKIISGIIVVLLLAGCASEPVEVEVFEPKPIETEGNTIDEVTGLKIETETGLLIMNLEELAQFNGKDGNLAFVAVDGQVYDVTNEPKWRNGDHNGQQAGQDVSAYITGAPHGKGILERFTVVGKIVD